MKKASINFVNVEYVYNCIDEYFLEYLERRRFYLNAHNADELEVYHESMCYYARLVDNFSEVLGMLGLLPDGITICDAIR